VLYLDKILYNALVFDCFGGLLTEKQRETYELAHNEDMSLAEISQITGVSPQGVSDMLRRTQKILDRYEEKTGLVKSRENLLNGLKTLREQISALPCEMSCDIDRVISTLDSITGGI
jgi:predicted DNA-binding protein YlxM (UPF0122 family)